MFVKNFSLQICTVYQRIQILYQILWIKYGEMLNEENLLKILLIDANIEDRKVYLFSKLAKVLIYIIQVARKNLEKTL